MKPQVDACIKKSGFEWAKLEPIVENLKFPENDPAFDVYADCIMSEMQWINADKTLNVQLLKTIIKPEEDQAAVNKIIDECAKIKPNKDSAAKQAVCLFPNKVLFSVL